jgi:hypothetical protein
VDLDRDRGGDLDHEEPDDPIVWFDADQLATASTIEIGSATIPGASMLEIAGLHVAPHVEGLAAREPGVSLVCLPGWPGAGPSGQGLGPSLGAAIGPLQPGSVMLLGGSRGSGRTSLLAQLADGLALADAGGGRPILLLSDDPPRLWRARSLARFADVDARACLSGDVPPEQLAAFAHAWAALDRCQRFAPLARLDRVEALLDELLGLAADLPARPLVIVDALAPDEARTQLPVLARLASERAAIVLVAGDDEGFTRSEDRHLDLRVRLRPESACARVVVEIVHRRVGPRDSVSLAWSPSSGRFAPHEEVAEPDEPAGPPEPAGLPEPPAS